MIVVFDFSSFEATCSKSSEQYKASLCDFDAIGTATFKGGNKWCNCKLVLSVVFVLSKLQGQ
jgi:hypothetical protein